MPVDCISAYMVVDPTNLNPSRFSSLLRASDSILVVALLASIPGTRALIS